MPTNFLPMYSRRSSRFILDILPSNGTLSSMHRVDYCADSFAYLKALPDKCVDVTITDPPYSKHVHENLCSGSLVGTKNVPKYELEFDPIGDFGFIKDLVRVTKRWVGVFCCLEDLGRMSDAIPEYVRGC